jgi:hypothetical protein
MPAQYTLSFSFSSPIWNPEEGIDDEEFCQYIDGFGTLCIELQNFSVSPDAKGGFTSGADLVLSSNTINGSLPCQLKGKIKGKEGDAKMMYGVKCKGDIGPYSMKATQKCKLEIGSGGNVFAACKVKACGKAPGTGGCLSDSYAYGGMTQQDPRWNLVITLGTWDGKTQPGSARVNFLDGRPSLFYSVTGKYNGKKDTTKLILKPDAVSKGSKVKLDGFRIEGMGGIRVDKGSCSIQGQKYKFSR